MYRDRLTLRQVWVRIQPILADHNSLLRRVLDAEQTKAQERQKVADVEDALAMFKRKG